MYLWDEAVCKGKPSDREVKALTVLQSVLLGQTRRRLWRVMQSYMSKKFGWDWLARARRKELHGVALEAEMVANCGEGQRTVGSSIHFGQPYFILFPGLLQIPSPRVHQGALQEKGPTSKCKQPPVGVEEKEVWECLTAVCKALSLANAKGKGTDGLVIRS